MKGIYASLFIASLISLPALGEVRVKHLIAMDYPRVARWAGVQGNVELIASVSPLGTVRDVRATSGSPFLIQPTKDVLKQWTFDGCESPQGCEIRIVFSFILTEGPCVHSGTAPALSEFEADLPEHVQIKARVLCAIVD